MWPLLSTFADRSIGLIWKYPSIRGSFCTYECWLKQRNSRNVFVVNCLLHVFICRPHTWLTWMRILSCLSVCSTTSKTELQGNLNPNNDPAAVDLESSGNSPRQGCLENYWVFLWSGLKSANEYILLLFMSPLCPVGTLYRLFLLSQLLHFNLQKH